MNELTTPLLLILSVIGLTVSVLLLLWAVVGLTDLACAASREWVENRRAKRWDSQRFAQFRAVAQSEIKR